MDIRLSEGMLVEMMRIVAIAGFSALLLSAVSADDLPLHDPQMELPAGWLHVPPPENICPSGGPLRSTYRNAGGTIWIIAETFSDGLYDKLTEQLEDWVLLETGSTDHLTYKILKNSKRTSFPMIIFPSLQTRFVLIFTADGKEDPSEVLR